jgi:hypothetical protein
MKTELARMGVVYLHLIACCVAIGLVFMSDLDMVKRLLMGDAATLDERHLGGLHQTLTRALLVLWLTGSGLVAIDVWTKGTEVLLNPKLQSKFAVVALLTVNGVVLHRSVLPMLQRAGALMRLTFSQRMLAVFIGAVSGVSWFYAAMLGVGRPLNFKYSLGQIMVGYPLLVATGFVGMVFLTAWAQYRASGGTRVFLRAPIHSAMHVPMPAPIAVRLPVRAERVR